MGTLYLIILANAANKTNRRTIPAGLTINGQRLVQVNPNGAEPEVFGMQKQEFKLFRSSEFFCGFNAIARSTLDHLGWFLLFWSVSLSSWLEEWRAVPWSCGCFLFVGSGDPGSYVVASSYCFTCKTGCRTLLPEFPELH